MAYPIEKKLVVGVYSNALFDLKEEDRIFREEGLEKFKKYQSDNRSVILNKGLAYPFIRRFLNINNIGNVIEIGSKYYLLFSSQFYFLCI